MRKHYPLNSQGAEDAGQLPWKDGVPSTGVEGSYPGQALFVDTEAEILAAIDASGQTRNGSDLSQLVQAIARGVYLGQFAGTANALAAPLPNNVVFASLLRGVKFTGSVTATNTAGVTLAITGIGSAAGVVQAPLLRKSGTALQSGDLPVGQDFEIRWDGNAFRMVGTVVSDGSSSGGSAATQIWNRISGYIVPAGGNSAVIVPLPATWDEFRLTVLGAGGPSGTISNQISIDGGNTYLGADATNKYSEGADGTYEQQGTYGNQFMRLTLDAATADAEALAIVNIRPGSASLSYKQGVISHASKSLVAGNNISAGGPVPGNFRATAAPTSAVGRATHLRMIPTSNGAYGLGTPPSAILAGSAFILEGRTFS